MKHIISFFLLPFIALFSFAQGITEYTADDYKNETNYGFFNYFQLTAYNGQHLVTEENTSFFDDGFYGLGVRFGTQSTGKKEWQRLHGYPQYGLGVSTFDLGGTSADSLVGKPTSIYFFYGAPIVRFNNFRLNADVEMGLSTNFKTYDAETNNTQIFIGATTNLHFNFTLALYYKLSERMDISFGASFLHFSNGDMFTPQKGLDIISFNLSSAYHFNPIKNFTKHVNPSYQPAIRPELVVVEKSPFKGHHEFVIMASAGTIQAEPDEWKNEDGELDTLGNVGPRYLTNSFTAEYAYQFAPKLKAVAGLDIFYDGSLENSYDDILPQNTTAHEKFFYGYHAGAHYLIERVGFMLTYGRYIYKPFKQRGNWFMRVGGRIAINNDLDFHLALKTRNGGIADWIEWGLAYKFK